MFYDIVFPNGKRKALSFSYDDGRVYDRRLVEMFNKYKVKGTFHINAGMIGSHDRGRSFIEWEDVERIYEGHEVSCHGYTHPFFSHTSQDQMVSQIYEEKKLLEERVCYPIRSMSYPYGDFTDRFTDIVKALGMEYSRTIRDTGKFILPDDYLRWDPTCHHNDALRYCDDFLAPVAPKRLHLFYIWGHSYEFEEQNNWEIMEELLGKLAGKDDVWYATGIEIKDYLEASRNLRTTADGKYVFNNSATTVYIDVDGTVVKVLPGENRCIVKDGNN